jgi:hypothetical protein
VGICVECSDKHNEVGLYAEWSDKQFDGRMSDKHYEMELYVECSDKHYEWELV